MDKTKNVVSVYDKIAKQYANKFSKPSEFIDEFLLALPGKKILDVGCGPGIDSGYMKNKGFVVTGIDLSKTMLKIAKKSFPDIKFLCKDIRKISYRKESFDGIFASCSLIHIPKEDTSKTLRKFYKILKNNGVLYTALQEGKSEETYINEPFKQDEKLFLNIISRDEIIEFLKSSGFAIIKIHERKAKSKEELSFNKLYIIAKKKN